ncbi:MAG: peptidoglycan DD-metalloendopeptidase family protein [Anaerolineaceae bacterium]|nr:peptidoglycan DD-metalloendopeptidase family protein [Anaerolineaceae bacterium]
MLLRMALAFALLCGALTLFAACQAETTQLAYVAPLNAGHSATPLADTPVPTANLATWTATASPTSSATATPSATPSITPTNIGTPLARETSAPTWTPRALAPARLDDHYVLERPIAAGAINWVDRTYPYGSTAGNRFPLHHGVEFVNARHTEVLAAASGSVYFAGDDSVRQFGPTTRYYGNLVVLQHDRRTPQGQALFTLYGHLESLVVATGEQVSAGDLLGQVGDSGIASGPHLHFEVRAGDPDSYAATRNPELWLRPFRGFGTLAGRVLDAAGNLLPEVTASVRSTDLLRFAWSYAGASVNSDDGFGENLVLGDLPANYYEITVGEGGRILFRKTIYIWPGRTNWLEIQLPA